MQLYSARPSDRRRQGAADVAAVVGIVVFAILGTVLAALIRTLGDVGHSVQSAGSSLADRLDQAASTLGGVPLVGGAASSPLKKAGSAGTALAEAGRHQQDVVGHIALAVGLVVALVPIAGLVTLIVVRHRRIAIRASRARMLASTDGGLDLLALRALVTGDRESLLRISPDPAAAWRSGDVLEVRLLAELALDEAGVTSSRR